ncbi:MAG TPA: 2-phosphosulfolactate phosphatase [Bacteroidetes bacterium]|nr:2-phosphosulfolactate phosphatase [Bacteroidota bacterium]
MNIQHLEFTEGAENARGIAVIIDVFRAFSTSCYLYGQGVQNILVTDSVEDAYRYRTDHPDTLLIGERNEQIINGFDYGNSPSAIIKKDFRNTTVILTTSAGTKGLVKASRADRVLAAGFVNAPATAAFISYQNPETVSLVAMGYNAVIPADEDRLCAEYISALLEGKKPDFQPMKEVIRNGTGARFFDPENRNSPEEDFSLCLQPGRFPYVLEAIPWRNFIYLKKTEINP